MATQSLDARIVQTPDSCGGKTRIDGRRITVQNIATWRGASPQSDTGCVSTDDDGETSTG